MRFALALVVLFATPQEKSTVVAVKGGKIYTVSKGVLENGVILIENGRIKKIGAGLDIPLDATVIELPRNAVVTPGFIDLHSQLASSFDTAEFIDAFTPHVRAVDAFASDHPDVAKAASSGVTTIAIVPDNTSVLSGRVGIVKLNGGRFDQMLFKDSVGFKYVLTSRALLRDREPTSKTGALQMIRERLRDPKSGEYALVKDRSLIAFVHAVDADEIQRAIALKEEFGLRMVLLHADGAWETLESLKNAEIPVACGPLRVDDAKEKLELPLRLWKSGVRFGFVSDAPQTDESSLRMSAAFAVKYGLDKSEALRALTLTAAEMLGVSDRLGSLEEGKDADLVVFGGEPLSLASDIEIVIVGGRVTYQKKK